MAENPVMINGRLNALDMQSMVVAKHHRLKQFLQPTEVTLPPRDQPMPVSPDGTLRPGILYESSTEANVRYYLPSYELRRVQDRFTSSLKLSDLAEDPEGPLAWLTIELVATPFFSAGFLMKEIEHEAVLRLGYQIPVAESEAPAGPSSDGGLTPEAGTSIAHFTGEWVNVDPETRGLTRLVIEEVDARRATIHGFGKCHPTDCDWGTTPGTFQDRQLRGRYSFSFKTTSLDLSRRGDLLAAHVFDDYTEQDGRADRISDYLLRLVPPASEPLRTTLWMDLGPLNRIGGTVRRCRMPVHSQETFDRLFHIMTDQAYNARLEIHCRATIGQRTWNQWFVGPVRKQKLASTINAQVVKIDPRIVRSIRTDVGHTIVRDPGIISQPHRIQPIQPDASVPVLIDASSVNSILRPSPLAAQPSLRAEATLATGSASHPIASPAGGPFRVVSPVFTAPSGADRPVMTPVITEPVAASFVTKRLPQNVLVERTGKPVLVHRQVTSVQTISPFWFSADTHGDMFDAPQDPGKTLVLFRKEIEADGETVTFFQDSMTRDQIYYEPQEFRLARADEAPFLPGLLFAVNLLVDVDDDNGPSDEVRFQVRCAYNVKPYISPKFVLKARLEYGQGAHFTALTPTVIQFLLRLPQDDSGVGAQEPREDALISFDDGIVDEVMLSEQQFARLAAAFQSPLGIGMQGQVNATLIDGSNIDIPVVVSLRDNVGGVFAHAFAPEPAAAGTYQITLRNRIESPVLIQELMTVSLGQGVTAFPTEPPPAAPIAPGDSVALHYRVEPPDATVVALEPALAASIEPDMGALLPQLTVNEGYHKDTFTIEVSIDRLFFDLAPAGMAPLTGVRVEFGSGTEIELAPGNLSQTAELRMPLLPRLMNSPEAQTYSYRLTNLHAQGEGLSTNWQRGEGNLTVIPPGPED